MHPTASCRTLGQLAAANPNAVEVLGRHGIELNAGDGRTVEEACRMAGIDPERLAAELEAAPTPPCAGDADWDSRPLSELIAHIIDRHHLPLVVELDRLQALLDKVLVAHGANDPERFEILLGAYTDLHDELTPHLLREEQVLFPWILSGQGASAGSPVRVMLHDHGRCISLLEEIRTVTDEFQVPEGACATLRALWEGLEALEADLREHIRLENDVLFPRALAGR